ncbi:MAG: AAA family ATPase [Puniceicoccales bacterium]|jgi:hypothetical protein|nr:AAA family ATPase [Puniceicoccales bacterium]
MGNSFLLGAYAIAVGCIVAPIASLIAYALLQRERSKLPLAVELESIDVRIRHRECELEELEREYGEQRGRKAKLDEDILTHDEIICQKRQEFAEWESRWKGLVDKKQEIEDWERKHLETQERLLEVQGTLQSLEEKEQDLSLRREKQERELKVLADERQRLSDSLEQLKGAEAEIRGRCAELQPLAQRVQEVEESLKAARAELEERQRERQRLGGEVDSLNFHKELAEMHLSRKREKLDTLLAEGQKEQKALEDVRERVKKIQEECAGWQAKEESWKRREADMEQLRANYQDLHRSVEELALRRDRLSGAVEVRQRQEDEARERAFQDLLARPKCLIRNWKGKSSRRNEQEALDGLEEYLESHGLTFHQRRLYGFHTALKSARTSPLTVLAGISGTGKSLLAKNYADAMGMHFLSLAVQPRWDGPQDLFGFYNYLEKRYVPTELAQAMVHMDSHNAAGNGIPAEELSFRDKMLLVLLDEMNLARVEYYFSDFLSKLEVRRGIDPENGERQAAEVVLGKESKKGEIRLFPVKNILFVGTMNEDESTQTLSDKVIDRSHLLSFARPRKFLEASVGQKSQSLPGTYLSCEQWESWCHGSGELPGDALEKIRGGLQDMNEALATIRKPFAHRVYNAIVEYIANYPDALATGDLGRLRRGWAFNDQVEMRLLPKLRGVDLADPQVEEALEAVRSVLEQDDWKDEVLLQAFDSARGSGKNQRQQFAWEGVCRDG